MNQRTTYKLQFIFVIFTALLLKNGNTQTPQVYSAPSYLYTYEKLPPFLSNSTIGLPLVYCESTQTILFANDSTHILLFNKDWEEKYRLTQIFFIPQLNASRYNSSDRISQMFVSKDMSRIVTIERLYNSSGMMGYSMYQIAVHQYRYGMFTQRKAILQQTCTKILAVSPTADYIICSDEYYMSSNNNMYYFKDVSGNFDYQIIRSSSQYIYSGYYTGFFYTFSKQYNYLYQITNPNYYNYMMNYGTSLATSIAMYYLPTLSNYSTSSSNISVSSQDYSFIYNGYYNYYNYYSSKNKNYTVIGGNDEYFIISKGQYIQIIANTNGIWTSTQIINLNGLSANITSTTVNEWGNFLLIKTLTRGLLLQYDRNSHQFFQVLEFGITSGFTNNIAINNVGQIFIADQGLFVMYPNRTDTISFASVRNTAFNFMQSIKDTPWAIVCLGLSGLSFLGFLILCCKVCCCKGKQASNQDIPPPRVIIQRNEPFESKIQQSYEEMNNSQYQQPYQQTYQQPYQQTNPELQNDSPRRRVKKTKNAVNNNGFQMNASPTPRGQQSGSKRFQLDFNSLSQGKIGIITIDEE